MFICLFLRESYKGLCCGLLGHFGGHKVVLGDLFRLIFQLFLGVLGMCFVGNGLNSFHLIRASEGAALLEAVLEPRMSRICHGESILHVSKLGCLTALHTLQVWVTLFLSERKEMHQEMKLIIFCLSGYVMPFIVLVSDLLDFRCLRWHWGRT